MADNASATHEQEPVIPVDRSNSSTSQAEPELSRANSARTWAYTLQNNPAPPVIPHPPAQPASPPYTYSDRRSDATDMYMNISSGAVDVDLEAGEINCGNDYANGRKRGHNFVGGFVSGLKRLPRAVRVVKGPRTTRPRRDTEATDNTILPRYRPPTELPQGERAGDPTNIVYAQSSEMPDHASYMPRWSSHGPNTEEAAYTIHPETVVHDVRVPALETASRRFSSSHRHPSMLDARSQEPFQPQTPLAPDYAQMPYGSPRSSFTGTFLSQGLPGLLDFFRHLYEMPWMADHRIVEDYRPGQSLPDQGKKKASRAPKSWYTPVSLTRHESLQLDLSGSKPPSPVLRPARTVANHSRPRRHGQSRHDRHRRSSSSPDYIPRSSRVRHRAGSRRHSGHRGSGSSSGMYSPAQPQFYMVSSPPPTMFASGHQAPGSPASPSTLFMVPVIPPIYAGNGQVPPGQGREGRYPLHSTPAPSAVQSRHSNT